MSRRPVAGDAALLGSRSPAREAASERVARVAAEALALLRTGDVAGCEAHVLDALPLRGHQREARALARKEMISLRAGHSGAKDVEMLGADIRSLFRVRGHYVTLADDGTITCTVCGRTAQAFKVWSRWSAIGAGDRRTDLTAGRCAGVRAA